MTNVWVWYGVIATVGILLIAGIVVGSIFLWRRQVRKSLIGLVGRREAVRAAYRGLESVFSALAEESPEQISEFATVSTSVHRRSLEELAIRMAMQVEELQSLALPKTAWHCADLLMAASATLRDEVVKINHASSPEAVLEGVGKIDVPAIRLAMATAGEELDRLLKENRIEDSAVYGGGLYI